MHPARVPLPTRRPRKQGPRLSRIVPLQLPLGLQFWVPDPLEGPRGPNRPRCWARLAARPMRRLRFRDSRPAMHRATIDVFRVLVSRVDSASQNVAAILPSVDNVGK